MGSRKLVKSGNTSFTIALPISWVRKNNLKAGNEVNITQSDQGDLILSSTEQKIKSITEEIITIKVDGKEIEQIHLEMLSAYLLEYNLIMLEGKEIISKLKDIIEYLQDFIGLDIIEQTEQHITIKNFFILDKETAPENIIKKINIINRASFNQLKLFFEKGYTREDFFYLQKYKKQNRKLTVMAKKSTLNIFTAPNKMKELRTNYLQILKTHSYILLLAYISNNLYSMGNCFLFLDQKSNEALFLKKQFESIYKNYDYTINSINNMDVEWIQSLIKTYKQQNEKYDDYLKSINDPMAVKACILLSEINYYLKDMCYLFLM